MVNTISEGTNMDGWISGNFDRCRRFGYTFSCHPSNCDEVGEISGKKAASCIK